MAKRIISKPTGLSQEGDLLYEILKALVQNVGAGSSGAASDLAAVITAINNQTTNDNINNQTLVTEFDQLQALIENQKAKFFVKEELDECSTRTLLAIVDKDNNITYKDIATSTIVVPTGNILISEKSQSIKEIFPAITQFTQTSVGSDYIYTKLSGTFKIKPITTVELGYLDANNNFIIDDIIPLVTITNNNDVVLTTSVPIPTDRIVRIVGVYCCSCNDTPTPITGIFDETFDLTFE